MFHSISANVEALAKAGNYNYKSSKLIQMLDRITVDELTTSSPAFANAMLAAGHFSTDELFEKFEQLDYKAFGFAAVQIWKLSKEDYWDCGLRNDVNWKEPKLDCVGKTVKEALSLLYGWCIHKNYLKL